MNDLQIIIENEQQLRSQTVKTKIKRFLLRKRKLKNVTLRCDFQNQYIIHRCVQRFEQIKQLAFIELKQGKNVPVKY